MTGYQLHFRIPISTVKNRRGPDGKFAIQTSPPIEEDTEEEEPEKIEETEEQELSTRSTSIDTLDDKFDFAAPIQIGGGKSKRPKNRKPNTPGKATWKCMWKT